MNNIKLYLLEFVRDVEHVVWEYTTLDETDRTKLSEIQFESTFDFTDKEGNYSFLILSVPDKIHKYVRILDDNLILHFLSDITIQILKDKINLERFSEKFDKPTSLLWKKFRTKIDSWMLTNQELDNVLDLINEKGIENLRIIDKKFLEEYGRQ